MKLTVQKIRQHLYIKPGLTVKCGEDLHVGFPEQRQSLLVDVYMRQMRDKVVPNQKPHQHPVVDDMLQIVGERQLALETYR